MDAQVKRLGDPHAVLLFPAGRSVDELVVLGIRVGRVRAHQELTGVDQRQLHADRVGEHAHRKGPHSWRSIVTAAGHREHPGSANPPIAPFTWLERVALEKRGRVLEARAHDGRNEQKEHGRIDPLPAVEGVSWQCDLQGHSEVYGTPRQNSRQPLNFRAGSEREA